jgi:hypothetical protein
MPKSFAEVAGLTAQGRLEDVKSYERIQNGKRVNVKSHYRAKKKT